MRSAGIRHSALAKSISDHCRTEQWQRDKGRFIPHPATFLNGRRWEDVLDPILILKRKNQCQFEGCERDAIDGKACGDHFWDLRK